MNMRLTLFALAAFAASGCQLPNPSPRGDEEEGSEFLPLPGTTTADVEIVEPRKVDAVSPDGSLVPAEEPGTIRIVDEPLREVEGVSNGRVWLLELYHGALAEKEQLTRRLADSERERAESAQSLAALTTERDQFKARCADLDKLVQELEDQSLDLAQRLAESEIARLEARKAELARESRTARKDRP